MKNALILCSLALLLASCEGKPAKQAITQKETTVENKDTVAVENLPEKSEVSAESNMENKTVADEQKNIVDILFPFSYWLDDDHTKKINNNWVSLYKDSSDNYYIKQAEYHIKSGYSEASDDSTKILESKDNVILFMDLPNAKQGKIDNIKISKKEIFPNDTVRFEFNGAQYYFRATGDVVPVPNQTIVRDYKLYVGTEGKPEELLLDVEHFEDNFMQVMFIGDIDGDNIPDFILNSSWHYEVESRTLFLSTKAEDGKITKQAGKLHIGFGG